MNKMIETIPKLAATGSFFLLLLAAFHDWGYFSIVGPHFQELQTPKDFIANSIEWLPASTFLLVSFAAVVSVFARRAKTDHNQGFGDVVAFRARRSLRKICLGLIAGLVGMLGLHLSFVYSGFESLFSFPLHLVVILVTIIISLSLLAFGSGIIGSNARTDAMIAGYLVVCVFPLWIAFVAGKASANYDLYVSGSNIYNVEPKSGSVVAVKILRTFEKGILEYSPTKRATSFVRWEDVKSLRRSLDADEKMMPLDCLSLANMSLPKEVRSERERMLAAQCIPSVLTKPVQAPVSD